MEYERTGTCLTSRAENNRATRPLPCVRLPVLLAITFASISTAQTISVTISNIPSTATRLVAVADQAGVSSAVRTSVDIPAGTASKVMSIAVSSIGTYRLRAIAFVRGPALPLVLRSGKASVSVTGSSASASISLSGITASLDGSTTVSGVTGAPARIAVNLADAGDFLDQSYGHVWYSETAITQNLATVSTSSGAAATGGSGSYQFVNNLNLPPAVATLRYQIDLSSAAFSISSEQPVLVYPDAASAATITVRAAGSVSLAVNSVPTGATRLIAIADGGGLGGVVRASQDVSALVNATMTIGLPAGGPYRIRVVAFQSGPSMPAVMASAQTAVASVPSSGSVAASATLSRIAPALDPATPLVADQGSSPSIKVNVLDPGDFLETSAGFLFYSATTFAQNRIAPLYSQAAKTASGGGKYAFAGPIQMLASVMYYQLAVQPLDFANNLESPIYAWPNLPADTSPLRIGSAMLARPQLDTQSLSFTLSRSNPLKTVTVAGVMSDSSRSAFSLTIASANNWLSVSASGGTLPATLQITANAANLPPGSYQGVVSVFANGAAAAVSVTVMVGSRPLTDFRNTGRADLMLYNPANGDTYAAMSDGQGQFTYVYGPWSPAFSQVRTGFFTNDAYSDIVLYNRVNTFGYFGTGDGTGKVTFQSLFWGGGYDMVIIADLNGDGLSDIGIYRSYEGTFYTGLSNGDSSFRYKYHYVTIGYTHFVTADFNGDGRMDILFYRKSDGLCYVGISDTNGDFAYSQVSAAAGYDDLQTGDFDGDGRQDILLYNRATGMARIGLSTGNGFTQSILFWSPNFSAVRTLDFNGDGKADVALYNKVSMLGYMGAGKGDGTFNFGSLFWGPGMDWVDTLDLNGDGRTDVIIYNSSNGAAFTGLSTGNLEAPFTYTGLYWGLGKEIHH